MHIPRMSRAEIAQDIQESLERLETDRIELYWLHRDAPAIPAGEILGMFNEHIATRRIGAIGCSNWTPERQIEASDFAKRNNITGFCASQIGFSLAKANPETAFAGIRFMDDATLRFHRETGTPLVAYSSQANGFFSGKYTRSMPREKGVLKAYGCEENFDRLDRAWALAEDHRRSANQVALSYVLSQPFPAYAIVGPRSVEQVVDSCRAAELQLRPEQIAELAG
jgi:aryl-alcohol dehydrogenase-like predicted oxidoreductase